MLLRILNGQRQGEVVPLGSDPITIGQGEDNQLHLPDSSISRQHAHVFSNQGKWFIKNIQPTKPIYVGDVPHSSTLHITPGSQVRIGNTLLQFEPNPAGAPPTNVRSSRNPLISLLLGVGTGVFILAFVLLFVTRGPLALSDEDATATQVAIALASATVTPTATLTPEPPTPTSTPVPEPTATATATVEPATPTPVPILLPALGEVTSEVYSVELLDPAKLDERGVSWNRDILMTVPLNFTNNGDQPININDFKVGLFASPTGERRQVPSFIVPLEDEVIEAGKTLSIRWQVVLPDGVELEAWVLQFNGETIQEFLQ